MCPPADDVNHDFDETLIGAIAEGLRPAELSQQQRASMRARILERTHDTQPPDTETVRGESIPWREAWPRVWVKVLKQDAVADMQITLLKFEPGGRIPGHAHRLDEECLVLEGEVRVGDHRVRAGDLHIARAGGQHADLVSERGALIMIRSELHRPHVG
jgi:quercetin dioxygenase-like cupin family protein